MKNYMKKLSQLSMYTSIIFIVIGLFLIIKPATTLSLISYVLGLVILVNGIITLIRYYSSREKSNLFDFGLILGIVEVVIAVIFISKPTAIASIIPLILGIWILVNGIFKLQFALNLKISKNDSWIYSCVIASLSILLGLVLILNPFEGAVVITQIIGGFLVGYAILDFLQSRTIKKTLQDGVEFIK